MANNTVYQPHKSSIGEIDANYIAVACYGAAIIFSYIPFLKFAAWLAPLLIYFLEKKSVLVKFHAVQALILNAIGAVISVVLYIVGRIIVAAITPDYTDYWNAYYTGYYDDVKKAAAFGTLFTVIAVIVSVALMIFEIMAALKAYKYTEYSLPVIGKIADKVSEKLSKVDFGGGSNTAAPPSQPPYNAPYTPPAQPWTPPAQPYTPPAAPKFDTQTGQPIAPPPAPPAAQKFDTQTGLPINPPAKPEDPNNSNT